MMLFSLVELSIYRYDPGLLLEIHILKLHEAPDEVYAFIIVQAIQPNLIIQFKINSKSFIVTILILIVTRITIIIIILFLFLVVLVLVPGI